MSSGTKQTAAADGEVAAVTVPGGRKGTVSSRIRNRTSKVLPSIVMGIILLLLLELLSLSTLLPRVVTPSPFTVLEEMWFQATGDVMWRHMRVTLEEGVLGFFIGAAIGFVLGVGIGVSNLVSRATYPYVILVQSMPRVALAPVFIAMLGFGQSPKVLTAVVICFFPVLINTIVGLRSYDPDALLLMRSLHAKRFQIFRKLLLPGALPMIFGGLKTSMTFALLGAIVGELTAANEGIGMLIEVSAFQLRMHSVYGYIMWMSIVSLVLFGAMELLDRRIVFWRDDPRKTRMTDEP